MFSFDFWKAGCCLGFVGIVFVSKCEGVRDDDIAVMLASDFKGKETEREMTKEQGSISW